MKVAHPCLTAYPCPLQADPPKPSIDSPDVWTTPMSAYKASGGNHPQDLISWCKNTDKMRRTCLIHIHCEETSYSIKIPFTVILFQVASLKRLSHTISSPPPPCRLWKKRCHHPTKHMHTHTQLSVWATSCFSADTVTSISFMLKSWPSPLSYSGGSQDTTLISHPTPVDSSSCWFCH